MNKFYSVKIGRNPGIYTSWSECEKQVKGFSGAIYKSFKNEKDAINFISSAPSPVSSNIEIYTDGCHKKHSEDNYIGYGAYCSYLGKEYRLSGTCEIEKLKEYGIEHTSISNPTAEYIGFVEVLKILSKILKEGIVVFKIDYIGVKNWTEGTWKCKEEHIKRIKEKADQIMKNIDFKVVIEYVPGHSGNYGNEQVDLLAKSKEKINTFEKLIL